MKSKKIIVPIIIILIILLMAGAAFAYVYTATDILKSDRELFFKYFEQITSEDGFVDKKIDSYNEKKKQTPYENSGEVTVDVQYPDEEMNKIIEKVNELAINFSGKIDSVNQKVEQNIVVDYGNGISFPINYRQDGNTFGLQKDELSKKYIAVRNENLKQLSTNLGAGDVSIIPDTIEFSKIAEDIKFTDEEKETLKQIYGTVLEQNLLDENFSSIKTEQNVSYTLELNKDQVKNIVIKMLEATKQNTLIIDKINDFILAQNENAEKIEVTVIDDIIADLTDMPNLKLILIQADKELKQITIQLDESKISIKKSKVSDSLSYNVEAELTEKVEETTNSLFEQTSSTPTQYNMYFNVQYKGLELLSTVQEKYEFGFETTNNEESMKYDYEINANNVFATNISIGTLDETTAVFLNDYNDTQVTNFLAQVGTRLAQINKNQMTELGLNEYENPLLYTNPITMLGVMVYNMASESINNVDLSQQEKSAFNNRFLPYAGENKRGSEVNALIKTVQNNSLLSSGTEPHLVKVTLDGTEVLQNVDSSKTYNIEAVYNEEGYITEMKVTVNN